MKPFRWQRPPLWLRLLAFPLAALLAVALTQQRGIAVGVFTGAVYGLIGVSLLFWDRLLAWAHEHPFLDSLILAPLVFIALALTTNIPLAICAAISLLMWAPLVLAIYLQRRRQS